MGLGPSGPGVGYNILVCHLLRPLVKCSIGVGVTRFSRCYVSQFPWLGKGIPFPLPLRFLAEAMPRAASALAGRAAGADCPALPSEMNPVPQLKMQKSLVFCVTHAGSWRLELFLFGHLAPPPAENPFCANVCSNANCLIMDKLFNPFFTFYS